MVGVVILYGSQQLIYDRENFLIPFQILTQRKIGGWLGVGVVLLYD